VDQEVHATAGLEAGATGREAGDPVRPAIQVRSSRAAIFGWFL